MSTFYLIENIFTNKERKDLIEKSKPFLVDLDYFPGRQSIANLAFDNDFRFHHERILRSIKEKTGLKFLFTRSWVNWSNGKKEDLAWHTHPSSGSPPCDFTAVYYMQTLPFFNNGTLFRLPIGFVKAPQNSLLMFPPYLEHTAPTCPFPIDRYAFAVEMVYANGGGIWMNS